MEEHDYTPEKHLRGGLAKGRVNRVEGSCNENPQPPVHEDRHFPGVRTPEK
jgi:hypothetical protein